MHIRIARHTTSLQPVIDFYTQLLGCEILGDFKNHDNYDGVFIGIPGENWHLEFTISDEKPVHTPDEDDLLVFYGDNYHAYTELVKKARSLNIPEVEAKNPYWTKNGTTLLDPDGFRIVLTYKQR
ncbi:hypothetical protein CLV59_101173 [Chitinophaga dinghuensis]|uniref:VOC domain-containing protein n=1 Tax=Chitinophaga dinghuensis TaxID=1539050 RepID=A0A327WA38_9BACT|nr:VOC family protein [Chitinophaga dinghuensis]RAJ87423.1 hypothetical protein CLV59_101173 [Chitinophaga dinghuensis]